MFGRKKKVKENISYTDTMCDSLALSMAVDKSFVKSLEFLDEIEKIAEEFELNKNILKKSVLKGLIAYVEFKKGI